MHVEDDMEWYQPTDLPGGAKEGFPEYLARVRSIGIAYPEDVLEQWFFEHPSGAATYDWLGLGALRFELREWPTDEVPGPEIAASKIVESNIARYERVRGTPRLARIEAYFRENGTWPRPIIVLSNPGGRLQPPGATWCRHPYDLVEGHNRLTVFHCVRGKVAVQPRHRWWLLTAHGNTRVE